MAGTQVTHALYTPWLKTISPGQQAKYVHTAETTSR